METPRSGADVDVVLQDGLAIAIVFGRDYHGDMDVRAPRRGHGHRATEWMLLSVAVVFALAFAASFAYMGYAFLFSLSRAFEEGVGGGIVVVILLPTSLVISIVASLWLVRLQKKRQREAC